MVEGSLHKGLAISLRDISRSRLFSINTLLSRVKCFWLPGIKLDIMNSFPGTRTIRRYYKTKWNFCKGKFYFRKVEVEFSFTFKKSLRYDIFIINISDENADKRIKNIGGFSNEEIFEGI